ncbi:MAG: hypothetical protein R3E01_18705 [Pirellulaceae bacterium]
MSRLRFRYMGALLCLGLAVTGGCNSSEKASEETDGHAHSHEHEHEGAPKSLHEAIDELRDMWAAISTAMDNSDPEAAHDPLHDVGKLLEAMPDLAAETDLPESEWNEIKSEVGRLFEAFGDIDSAFHKQDGDKVAAYESAKATIDEGIAAFEAKIPLLGETASPEDDGHDDEDHDHDHEHGNEDATAEE